jgi:hypothetical protein
MKITWVPIVAIPEVVEPIASFKLKLAACAFAFPLKQMPTTAHNSAEATIRFVLNFLSSSTIVVKTPLVVHNGLLSPLQISNERRHCVPIAIRLKLRVR